MPTATDTVHAACSNQNPVNVELCKLWFANIASSSK